MNGGAFFCYYVSIDIFISLWWRKKILTWRTESSFNFQFRMLSPIFSLFFITCAFYQCQTLPGSVINWVWPIWSWHLLCFNSLCSYRRLTVSVDESKGMMCHFRQICAPCSISTEGELDCGVCFSFSLLQLSWGAWVKSISALS